MINDFDNEGSRTTIANSDSDAHAYTNTAIDQGYRAVKEMLADRRGYIVPL
jgi:hypothetical protein